MPTCSYCGAPCTKEEMSPRAPNYCIECQCRLEKEQRAIRKQRKNKGYKRKLPPAYCVYDPTGIWQGRYYYGWSQSIGVWPENSIWEVRHSLGKDTVTYLLRGSNEEQVKERIECRK